MDANMKFFLLALVLLPACSTIPLHPSEQKPSSIPARFDYERDDELDDDLSRAENLPRSEQPA
jgi:hypothetical protein